MYAFFFVFSAWRVILSLPSIALGTFHVLHNLKNWTSFPSSNTEHTHTHTVTLRPRPLPPWSKTHPDWKMNNRGIPYVSACKTRSPTVHPRKFGKLRGHLRASGGWWGIRLRRTEQTVHCVLTTSGRQTYSGVWNDPENPSTNQLYLPHKGTFSNDCTQIGDCELYVSVSHIVALYRRYFHELKQFNIILWFVVNTVLLLQL